MHIALPDNLPYIYITLSGSTGSGGRTSGQRDRNGRTPAKVDMAAMKWIILEAIPKAMSRQQERWALESKKLTTRSLRSICGLRGNSIPGTSGGAYSILVAEDESKIDTIPIGVQLQMQLQKDKFQQQLDARSGMMQGQHHALLDRVHVKIEDLTQVEGECRSTEKATPLSIIFSGNGVFSGLGALAELGPEYIDLQKCQRG